MGWLTGWNKRIKLTIDHTKIDDTLSNFPVTVFFTDAQAEEIFAEFDADEDFDRGQFALGDDTLLYAEKELFDHSESKAIYHVKIPSISSSVDTDYYFYYDNDADHSTTYIGAIGTTAGENVWDSNFKAVYHMADNTTSTILDSTSNDNDGTKQAANEPVEASGKVGQAQDFDGSDDYITIADSASLDFGTNTDFTLESCIKYTSGQRGFILAKSSPDSWTTAGERGYCLRINSSEDDYKLRAKIFRGDDSASVPVISTNTYNDGVPHYFVGTFDRDGNLLIYIDGSPDTFSDISGVGNIDSDNKLVLGAAQHVDDSYYKYLLGTSDEIRISGTLRNAAWIKATYNSLWDTLLTYGSEETEEEEDNAIFFGFNF